MRHTDFNKVLKTALLLTTAILIIGSTAALQWESPDSDVEVISGDQTLNITDGASGDASIWYRADDVWESIFVNQSNSGTSTYYWVEESPNFGDLGSVDDLELKANTTDDEEILTLTLDQGEPSVSLQDGDLEYVNNNHEITVVAEDSYSNIDDVSAFAALPDVLDQKGVDCASGMKCKQSFDLNTDSLETGEEISLTLEATDQVGNSGESSKGLVFDDSYQADEPTFSIDGEEDGVVSLSGDVDVDADIGNAEDEESDIQVKCMVDGDEVSTSDWDDDGSYTCEIPEDEVEDETVDVSVEACDEAGNCDESDEEEITFDASNPEVESFETVAGYNVFGDDFKVKYEASDSATSIESIEYFFSTAVLPGDGNEINAEADEFKVETSLLSGDSNDHTVYMRVKDEAGHWSSYQSLDFEYYPDEKPSLDLAVPENFSIKAGNSRGFDVIVENDGKLMIESVNVSVESGLFSGEKKVEDLVGEESQNVEFVVSPNESEIGIWTVEASTDGPVDSVTTEVLVEANTDQRDEVDQKLDNFTSRMEKLESNISSLQEDGLKEELSSSLESGVESFRQSVQAAEESADNGDYFKAYSKLENIEQKYDQAMESFSEVQDQHRINERNKTLMMVLAGLALILVAGGAFAYTREDYELLEQLEEGGYELPEMGGMKESVSKKVSGLKSFLKSEEEQVEDAFEGFK